jgi:hypothetical protein
MSPTTKKGITMESAIFNGKKIVFKTVRSSVLKTNQRTESNFNAAGTGGGGGMDGNIYGANGSMNGYFTGTIAPISYTLTGGSVTIYEYWLKDDQDTEFTIELLQSNIRAREGNELSVLYANVEGDARGFIPVMILNHGTKAYELLMNGKFFLYYRFNEDVKFTTAQLPFLIRGSAVLGAVLGVVMQSFVPFALLAIVGIAIKTMKWSSHKSEIAKHNDSIEKKRSELDVMFNQHVDEILSTSGLKR